MGAGELGEAFQRPMGAKPNAIGVGGGNEAALKRRHNHIAKGMMHHAVAIGSSGNHPGFGFHDAEGAVVARLVRF